MEDAKPGPSTAEMMDMINGTSTVSTEARVAHLEKRLLVLQGQFLRLLDIVEAGAQANIDLAKSLAGLSDLKR